MLGRDSPRDDDRTPSVVFGNAGDSGDDGALLRVRAARGVKGMSADDLLIIVRKHKASAHS